MFSFALWIMFFWFADFSSALAKSSTLVKMGIELAIAIAIYEQTDPKLFCEAVAMRNSERHDMY